MIIVGAILVMIITSVCTCINNYDLIEIIFSGLWSAFLLIRSYLFVYYRLDFRFKSLLYISCFASLSMLIGGIFMYCFQISIFIVLFMSEFLMSILMILDYKHKFKNLKIKMLNKQDFKSYLNLIFANSILNLISYSDRILLNLLLRVVYVPLFFVATTIGKISNLLINPIVTVLLSYEVNKEE